MLSGVTSVTCHAVWGRSYVTTTQLAGVLLSDAQLLDIILPPTLLSGDKR